REVDRIAEGREVRVRPGSLPGARFRVVRQTGHRLGDGAGLVGVRHDEPDLRLAGGRLAVFLAGPAEVVTDLERVNAGLLEEAVADEGQRLAVFFARLHGRSEADPAQVVAGGIRVRDRLPVRPDR